MWVERPRRVPHRVPQNFLTGHADSDSASSTPVVNHLPHRGARPTRRNGTTGASRRQVAGSARQNFWRFRDRGGSPCGRTGQKFWLGPKGLPSPELDPAQPRWEALIIERRNGVVRMERDELSSFVIAVHEVRRELGR